MAMLDAVELAGCLTDARFGDSTAALSAFEAGMLARTSDAARETAAAQDLIIAGDVPERLIGVMAAG